MVVVSTGRVAERDGVPKLWCVREETGGDHGWLKVSGLTPLRPKKKRAALAEGR